MMRAPFLVVLFVLLFSNGSLAQGKADPAALPVDAKGVWHDMFRDTSVESCMPLRSAACALQVMMACQLRAGDACLAVLEPNMPYRIESPPEPGGTSYAVWMSNHDLGGFALRYRVERVRRVVKTGDAWSLGFAGPVPIRQIGDVVALVRHIDCASHSGKLHCDSRGIQREFILRQQPDGMWRVIFYDQPGR
ncbi:MAG: hypothetical protein VW600_02705 [Ferrovibrio sp.]